MVEKHVHDCTGPDMTCPCGYKFRVPPVWVNFEVGSGQDLIIGDAFNCETIYGAIRALREAANKLESMAATDVKI